MKKKKWILAAIVALVLCVGALVGCGTRVTLVVGDGSTQKASVPAGAFTLPVPERVGYAFTGWFDAESGGAAYTDAEGKGLSDWQKGNPATLYAQWTLKTYTFILDVAGGTMDAKDNFELEYLELIDDLPVPTRTGYSFVGWFNSKDEAVCDRKGAPNDDYKQFNATAYPPSGSSQVTLTAKWSTKTVTYAFINEGETVEEIQKGLGETFELPLAQKAGYTFMGWSRSNGGEDVLPYRYTPVDTDDDYTPLYASYHTATVAGVSFTAINNDRAYKVSYTGEEEEVYIPDLYSGKPVTQVSAIKTMNRVKKLYLPHTVTIIDAGAIRDIVLSELRLPQKLTALADDVLQGCLSLKTLDIPASITSIGARALAGTSLETVSIPAGVRSIGANALDISWLRSIDVDEGNNYYCSIDGVLYEKSGTTLKLQKYPALKSGETFTPDNRVIEIMDGAFKDVRYRNVANAPENGLRTVTVHGKIARIGKNAFQNSDVIRVDFLSAQTSLTVDEKAFYDCKYLRIIKSERATPFALGTNAFNWSNVTAYVPTDALGSYRNANGWRNNSNKIKAIGTIYEEFAVENIGDNVGVVQYIGTADTVVVPEYLNGKKVVRIGASAFYGAEQLKNVTLPATVTAIGNSAFTMCGSLEWVHVQSPTPPTLGNTPFGDNDTVLIYVSGDPTPYYTAAGWSAYKDRISTKA